MKNQSINSISQIVKKLAKHQNKSKTLMILGTGWNHIINKIDIVEKWNYKDVFGLSSGVSGHAGELLLAQIHTKLVWIMAGRFHIYEGFDSQDVVKPIQAFSKLGIKNLVITSASGGLNNNFKVGDIVVLSDILALFCKSPLVGDQFQDLSQPFDNDLRNKVIKYATQNNIPFQKEGIYAYVRGPHFETFSDKKALKSLGADCVGMSTVPEVIMANFLGLTTLGLSCVTNLAFVKHSHEDVKAAALAVKDNMVKVLSALFL